MSGWLGEDWEKYSLLLLTRRHGADQVQVVPARHKGDLGIEAFTHDGCAMQCYAPQEAPVKERFEKQRDKLTVDLGKLESRTDELLELLGDVRIETYYFMVPVFDSHRIVQHATAKASETRSKNLPHIHPNFRILVVTADQFADVHDQVMKRPLQLVSLVPASGTELSMWIADNEAAVHNAASKLAPYFSSEHRHLEVIQSLVRQYIEGRNALSRIRTRYPDEWERIASYISQKENLLVLEYSEDSPASTVLKVIAKEVATDLERCAPNLDDRLRLTISWSTVADWLMRCPLYFAEAV